MYGQTYGWTKGNSPLCLTAHQHFGAADQKKEEEEKEEAELEKRQVKKNEKRKELDEEGKKERFSLFSY